MAKTKGFPETLRNLARIKVAAPLAALAVTREQARELLRRARAVAPRLTGRLEQSGKVTDLRTREGAAWGVSFDTEYAIVRHEDFYDLGVISQAKAPTEDGPIGRKFLERPYVNMRDQIVAKIAAAVRREAAKKG